MKLVTLSLGIVFMLISLAAAVPAWETNAHRLARGLPPNAPLKRFSASEHARRATTSGTPSQCATGPIQCCKSLVHANHRDAALILGLLGISIDRNLQVGITCSPLTVIGVGSNSCSASSTPVCCTNNSFNGIIALGCTAVNVSG